MRPKPPRLAVACAGGEARVAVHAAAVRGHRAIEDPSPDQRIADVAVHVLAHPFAIKIARGRWVVALLWNADGWAETLRRGVDDVAARVVWRCALRHLEAVAEAAPRRTRALASSTAGLIFTRPMINFVIRLRPGRSPRGVGCCLHTSVAGRRRHVLHRSRHCPGRKPPLFRS
jgi:hypothetical protein